MKKLSEVWKREGKAYLGVIAIRTADSGLIVIAKIALNHGMSPQVYSLYRYFVASIVVAPFCFLSYRYFFILSIIFIVFFLTLYTLLSIYYLIFTFQCPSLLFHFS